MKVLYLCHRIPYPPNKGEKIRAFHQLKALSERHEVDLFTLGDGGEDLDGQRALEQHCRTVKVFRLSEFKRRLRSLPFLVTRQPLTLPSFYSGELQAAVRHALRAGTYDRIFLYSAAMAQYVDGGHNIPVVMDLVDVDSDKWRQYVRFSAFPMARIYEREARCLRDYERTVCTQAWVTLVTSEREAGLLRDICAQADVRVIPNGVDTEYFKPDPSSPGPVEPTMVFTGDMSYFPNVEAVTYFAQKVFPLVRSSVGKARFLIVGRNPTRQVRCLQQINGVEVTGTVPDVRVYLRQAQIFVAPFSISAGIPNKILEAMSFGLPVVGTACAVQGLSRSAALAIDIAASAQEFADKTTRLITDRELAHIRGTDGRRRVIVGYRWDSAMREMLDILEQPAGVSALSKAAAG